MDRNPWTPDVESAINAAAQRNGLAPSLLSTFAKIESSGNPAARTGSYSGLFQLSPGEFGKYGGGDIFNANDNANAAGQKLANETASFKSKYGRDPSASDLYMVHQQGEGGYGAHVANPSAPAWQNMYSTAEGRQKGPGWAKQAIWGNVPADVRGQYPGGVDSLTSQQFINMWRDKVDRIGGAGMPVGQNIGSRLAASMQGLIPGYAGDIQQPNVSLAPAGAVPGAMPPEGLTPPSQRYGKLADALMASAAGAKPTGWGSALNAFGDAALGYSLANKDETAQKAYTSKLSQALSGAGTPEALNQTLIGSGDEGLRNFGVQSKLQEAKEQRAAGRPLRGKERFLVTPGGVMDVETNQMVPGTEKAGKGAEFGTSPQYWKDKGGKLHISQLSKGGGQQPVEFPADAEVLPGIDYRDTGTAIVGRDKRGGQVVVNEPKDIIGKESQEEVGKQQGIARSALPGVEDTTNRLLDRLDRLEKSPMRKQFTGYRGYLPVVSPEARDYQALQEEVQGNTFLTAFANLRGGGSITDVEGKKATAALTRLQTTAPSDPGYQAALDDAKQVFNEIRNNVRQRAGQAVPPSDQPPSPDLTALTSKYGLE